MHRVANSAAGFSFQPVGFFNIPASFARRLDQVLITADHAEKSNPLTVPRLP